MLYNYPRSDIFKMLNLISEAQPSLAENPSIKNNLRRRSYREIQLCSLKDIRNELQSMKLDSYRNMSRKDMKSFEDYKIKARKKKNCKSTQFKPYKKYYTTMNNSIKYIADIAYREIGEGEKKDRMSFANFDHWVKMNDGILNTFDMWLRKNVWTSIKGDQLQYRQFDNALSAYVKVNFKTKNMLVKLYKKSFIEFYNGIIFIYKTSSGIELQSLKILKNLEVEFSQLERKIKISFTESKRYKNLTIIFDEDSVFEDWKKAMEPYLKESVDSFYMISEKIGRGTFSTVNLGIRRDDPSARVAIKTIVKATLKPDEKALISDESLIMQKLDHPSVIKYLHQFEDTKKLYIILELAEGGDLYERIISKGKISENQCKVVMKQLFEVLKYLHKNNILHRDLKPENIMINTDLNTGDIQKIKLIDFGFATYFSKDNLPTLSCGTLNYAAPEVLLGETYDESSDLFSCGVILYFM